MAGLPSRTIILLGSMENSVIQESLRFELNHDNYTQRTLNRILIRATSMRPEPPKVCMYSKTGHYHCTALK